MKKVILIAVITSVLMACNNAGTSSVDNKVDSIKDKIDSTTNAKIDTIKQHADSLKNKVENTFEKTDSANKAISKTAGKHSGTDTVIKEK